jgi:nucleobase:cation symporter-1, NCS1 family
LLVGLIAGWAFEYGSVSLFQGPLSRATNGIDFSWLASILASGIAYYTLARARREPVHSTAVVEETARPGIARP